MEFQKSGCEILAGQVTGWASLGKQAFDGFDCGLSMTIRLGVMRRGLGMSNSLALQKAMKVVAGERWATIRPEKGWNTKPVNHEPRERMVW